MFKKFYSQAGQDKWVVTEVFNFKKKGFFLEIGAYDGRNLSNTYWLEKHLGWDGVCIEADKKNFEKLRINRKCLCLNICVGSGTDLIYFVAERGPYSGALKSRRQCEIHGDLDAPQNSLPTIPICQVFTDCKVPRTIDYLSLDVEGMEYEVMEKFPFGSHTFLCATIERPEPRLRELLHSHGYILVCDQPGLDSFFIHPSIANAYTGKILNRSQIDSFGAIEKIIEQIKFIFKNGVRDFLLRL
jgi:FkbM family methyltransferase